MEQVMTQINVRIGRETKRKGDEGLSLANISPSRALRALWSYFARHRMDPDAIARIVEQLEETANAEVDTHMQAVLAESGALVQASNELMALSSHAIASDSDDKDLLEQALLERYAERGLL